MSNIEELRATAIAAHAHTESCRAEIEHAQTREHYIAAVRNTQQADIIAKNLDTLIERLETPYVETLRA